MGIIENIFTVIVKPGLGWYKVNKSSIATQQLMSKAFYPLLVVLSLSEFVPMFYDSTLKLSSTVMLAISAGVSYFAALHLTSWVIEGCYPDLNPTNEVNSRINDFICYNLIFLVILNILRNLLPTGFAPLYFLVLYMPYMAYCGAEFVGLEPKQTGKFVLLASTMMIFTPFVIYTLLKGIFTF